MVQTAHEWTPLLAAHVSAASLALVLGAAQIIRRPKGDRPHRWIGRTWVALMYFVALSSFFLQLIRPGNFSFIHLLSILTIVTVSLGLWFGHIGNVRHHRGNMVGSYIGLWGAFIGAVVPNERLIPIAFQESWAAMATLSVAFVAAGLALVAGIARLLPEPVSVR